MAAGELANYSALIMPWSSCVSQAEADAIEAFVRAGGTVIADSFCGVRDDHGAPRPMLDKLFGIRQTLDVPELAPVELKLTKAPPGFVPVPVASGSAANNFRICPKILVYVAGLDLGVRPMGDWSMSITLSR